MSTHKHIDRICVAITVFALLVTVLFMNGKALGLESSARSLGYETTLFDTSRVHTIDIVMDDWDAFLDTATSEEYAVCSVVIDNDAVKNVAIRGKGNTSLSTVATMNSDRYSFKIEFDHFEDGKTYQGLDKLCLNNLIQDNTYMKDYLAYRLMNEFGADSPLCSFAWVTVNGEDWGLYLAVEAVEDSFINRVYGGSGDIYKPDSISMGGGGPGNGRDFNLDDFVNENAENLGFPWNKSSDSEESSSSESASSESGETSSPAGDSSGSFTPPSDGDFQPPTDGNGNFQFPTDGSFSFGDGDFQPPTDGNFQPPTDGSFSFGGEGEEGENSSRPSMPGNMPGGMGGGMPGGMGMGSSDVKLQYVDDDPDSYANIFDSAKTTLTSGDKTRLIRSLKSLSEGEDLESVLDLDEVLRYFVVHNYLVNSDSYTGSMVHNYYLREADGQLSMIPWDYNLAFGTFQGGSSATSAVNDPIDSPLSVTGDGSRPMVDWIFQSEEYTQLYHQYFRRFLDEVDIQGMIDEAYALIKDYVAKDPTAFCTEEEFETGVAALRSFCEKRTESIQGQLAGTIPSTDAGQEADSSALVDASDLTLSDLGSFGSGGGGGFGGFGGMPGGFSRSSSEKEAPAQTEGEATASLAEDGASSSQADSGVQPETPAPQENDGTASLAEDGSSSQGSGERPQPPSGDGSGGFSFGGGNGDFQPPSDGNGNFSPPDGSFSFGGGNGDFQPPTDGNGNFTPPDGDFSFGDGSGNFQPPSDGFSFSGGTGESSSSEDSGDSAQQPSGESQDGASSGQEGSQPENGEGESSSGRPSRGSGSFPGGGGGGSGTPFGGGSSGSDSFSWILVLISAVALAGGLTVAILYRK